MSHHPGSQLHHPIDVPHDIMIGVMSSTSSTCSCAWCFQNSPPQKKKKRLSLGKSEIRLNIEKNESSNESLKLGIFYSSSNLSTSQRSLSSSCPQPKKWGGDSKRPSLPEKKQWITYLRPPLGTSGVVQNFAVSNSRTFSISRNVTGSNLSDFNNSLPESSNQSG